MLIATSVCTWAATTTGFGNHGSTWTVGYSDDIDLYIEVKHKSDWNKLNLDWNGDIQVSHGNQKKVVIVGPITQKVFELFITDDKYKQCFATAYSLDMSGATFENGSDAKWESLKSQMNKLWYGDLVWAHTKDNVVSGKIYYPGDIVIKNTAHVTLSASFEPNDVCDIHKCGSDCKHSLSEILSGAGITKDARVDLVKISLDNKQNKVTDALDKINTFALDLTGVTSLDTTTTTWSSIKNQYVGNVILPVSMGDMKIDVVKKNFNLNKLYNVIVAKFCDSCNETHLNAYINKPGFFATGLQYVSIFEPQYTQYEYQWYNENVENHKGRGYKYDAKTLNMLKVSGYVFARDLKTQTDANLDADGHLIASKIHEINGVYICQSGTCECTLAPSYKEIGKTVHYCDKHAAAPSTYLTTLRNSKITSFDLTDAEFGYVDENGVFQYYPADMNLSQLQQFATENGSVAHLKLPTSPTQYIIPEGFLHDSKYIHELCIPHNYTEIHRLAFLGSPLVALKASDGEIYGYEGGINHYTTTAAKDDELKGIKAGQVIDYGEKTLTLPSTLKYVGRGAFSGYGGSALIEDVYVLAEKAPICEFYAFDQKSYVGQDSHKQEHLIRKGNYVNPKNGMAMLHFPNTTDRIEMLNYSDMTRKYRLIDEGGNFDNMGNILVWPTQAQYNRSFNQALAGVTWFGWKEYETGFEDDPEHAYSTGWEAGKGESVGTHDFLFTKAAQQDGFSEEFEDACDHKNPHSNFDGSWAKGSQDYNDYMTNWDKELLDISVAKDQTDRPLTYDFVHYGGWHQFTIAELYDFMLDDPTPGPKPDYFNFSKYNKNIWYAVCFPFNLTKSQLQKALGDPENNKYPYVSTLAGVNRDPKKLKISVHMSKNLLNYKIQYDKNCPNTVKCDKSTGYAAQYVAANYGDDDIVIEANKPYFILPALPDEEIKKAVRDGSEYNRKSEISVIKQVEGEPEKVMFPVATHVHAVNGSFSAYINGEDEEVKDTTYAYNYYFVGNYIPQEMPENAYYLAEYQKSNGDWWSSFYYNNPKKVGKMWNDNDAIVIAIIEDNASGHSRSKGEFSAEERFYSGKTTQNYIWNINSHNDEIFFYGTGNEVYAKSSFGIQLENNYTTSIVLPDDFETPESDKVYNLNGQFVGTDSDRMAKGIYIVGGKKVVK